MISKNTKNNLNLLFLVVCFFFVKLTYGQMPGQDGHFRYGNEWIDYEKTYLRIQVGADGWYSVDYNQIKTAGWEEQAISGTSLILYHNGDQVPIEVTSEGVFGDGDQILFYGQKNRTELEQFMYHNPERQLLNSEYSLFSDTSVYFLTVNPDIPKLRYREGGIGQQDVFISDVWTETEVVFFDQYYTQATEGIIDPDFNDLEGFATGFGNSVTREINLEGVVPVGDSVYVEIGVGTDLNTRQFSLFVGDQVYQEFTNEFIQSVRQIRFAWPVGELEKAISITVKGMQDQERVAIAYIRVRHKVAVSTLDTNFQANFQLSNVGATGVLQLSEDSQVTRLYNLSTSTYFEPQENGSFKEFVISGSPGDDYIWMGSARRVSYPRPITFENYMEQDFDYLIITSDSLRRSSDGSDPISQYANYRSSEEGGGYQVKTVSIEQLRDQYIYGISGHPYAIRNFVSNLVDNQKNVLYCNIIGKGMGYGFIRSKSNFSTYHYKTHFVPTFGHYGSDNLLMSTKGQSIPRIPVGRIPVTTPDEIGYYLQKVKTYESAQQNPELEEDRLWMKRVMHFNGGDRNIFSIIANFMDGLGSEIQRDSFAAHLVSYYKSSFGTTDIPERDEIFSYINDGAALISFFGHSASSSLDFNIDIINEYENKGRLPIFLALGCSSGNIFLPQKNLAEQFILTPDVGSILFLSTATSEYLSNLQRLARTFYKEIGQDQYGQPMGDVVKKALEGLGNFQRHLQSVFVFAGDPAIAAYHFSGPDFTFDDMSVRLEPERPSLVDDFFTLEVDIQNLGLRHKDTFSILLRQQLPDGQSRTLDTVRTSVQGFDHTLKLKIPVTDDMEGKNTFYLTIDPDDQIKEYPTGVAESNNQLEQDGQQGFDIFIQNTTLQQIYPYDMAIIPDEQPSLELFNGNVEKNPKKYLIELDTTPLFSSPGLRSFTQTSNQARIIIPLEMKLDEEVVYYWRSRWAQDSVFTPYQSFVYLPDREGWNQSHYGQFHRDSLVNITADERKLEFAQLQNVYKLDHGYKKAAIIFNEIHRPRFFRTDYPALNVSIFKPRTNGWVNNPKPGDYNSIWPVSGDEYLFTFVYRPYSEEHRASIIDLIETEAEEGDYVIFWNTTNGSRDPQGESWAQDSVNNQGVNLFNFFEEKGATQIRGLAQEDRRAYSLIYQQGGGVVTEILGDSAGVNIEYVDLYSYVSEGEISSGEVNLLQSLASWESGVEIIGSDSVDMVFQVGNTVENEHFDGLSGAVKDNIIPDSESSVFSWSGKIRDGQERTLPSFYWRVFGSFRPDWRIGNINAQPLVDTALLVTNQLSVHFKVDKIGSVMADSVLVSVELFNGSRSIQHLVSVPADQWGKDLNYEWPVGREYSGSSLLKVTVDPHNDWAEAQENNNAIFRNFDIRGDRIAPTVEVLFDQQSILHGDIIAPNALITVLLTDYPNDNLSIEPDFEFEITKPSGELMKIDSNDPKLTIENTKKGMELRYQSEFIENGMYKLQVSVRDVIGNAQKTEFFIDFEVVLENSVSAILPYPNPFVDAVRFAYTLTGSEEPDVFRIMIYTVSGRLVKEITKTEFGPMRIGRHLSEYVWDGTDNWNQKLAPGVYLYKVLTRDSAGSDYEKYQIGELEQGNYFKNGIGKMVKLR